MRNMIEANRSAFSNLVEQLCLRNPYNIPGGKRFFKTNDYEKKWLKELKVVDVYTFLPTARAIKIEFEHQTYICVIGINVESTAFDVEVLEDYIVNSGIITTLIAEKYLNLDIKIEELEFYDSILFQHIDSGYSGHDYADILKYVEPIQIYKLPENSILTDQKLSRILSYIFSKNTYSLILNFNKDVLDTVSEISLVGSNNISFELVLSCLLSTTYKHAFLEVYRLVERLFPVNYLKDFHDKAETKLPFLEFTATLEDVTSWRPREEDALMKIFDSMKPAIKARFGTLLSSSSSFANQKDHVFFYKLRNSIVHFRARHEETDLSVEQWNTLIIATLYLVDEQYSLYHNILQ